MNLNGPACIKWFNTWLLIQYLMANSILDGWLVPTGLSDVWGRGTNRYWIRGYKEFTGTTLQPHVTALYEQWTAVHCFKQCTALYCIWTVHCTAPHFTAPHCTTLHCTFTFHFTILFLHYTALNWTADYSCLRSTQMEIYCNWRKVWVSYWMKYLWLTVLM